MLEWLIFLIGGGLGFKGSEPAAAIAVIAVLLLLLANNRSDSASTTTTQALLVASSAIFALASYGVGRGIALLLSV